MTYASITPPSADLVRLIDLHGPREVLVAFARALLLRRRAARDVAQLPNHVRRDIGLPPRLDQLPRIEMRHYWEIR